MLKKDIELAGIAKYNKLNTKKIKLMCNRYHLTILSNYTKEIALFKTSNLDPDQVSHPNGCIFRVETAIKLFYDAYQEELDAIDGCKVEMQSFNKIWS